jgi:hypothetical protein
MRFIAFAVVCGLATAVSAGARAAEYNPARTRPAVPKLAPERVIVKFRAGSDQSRIQAQAGAQGENAADTQLFAAMSRIQGLAKRTGLSMTLARAISDDMHAVVIPGSSDDALAILRTDDAVEFAEPDAHRYLHATTPNDPLFAGQW